MSFFLPENLCHCSQIVVKPAKVWSKAKKKGRCEYASKKRKNSRRTAGTGPWQRKKFVTLREGADLYSIGLHSFRDLAHDAGAIYKVKRRILVNTEIFDEFLEAFREFDD